MSKNLFINSDIANKLANYKLPRFEQLPAYPLIMNQLLAILDNYLAVFSVPNEEDTLTQSMINSYVRKKVIEPPINKMYSRGHIIHLLSIGILKQVLSLSDVGKVIEMQTLQYPVDIAYNYFCAELEEALKVTFGSRKLSEFTNIPKITTPLTETVHSAVISFANKIYVKQSIYFEENNKK